MSEAGDPGRFEGVVRAFGIENRALLLERYFLEVPVVSPGDAWLHVYRLLLWIDRTTGLAHCYESDKCQPGRPWYARTLSFHSWISRALGADAIDLGERIDWLFKEAVKQLATQVVERTEEYKRQRLPYEGFGLPEPGEDPELGALIKEALAPWLAQEPPATVIQNLTRRIYAYMTQENKRKNLVGEGFEDVIASVVRRMSIGVDFDVRTRSLLSDLPGFYPQRTGEKPKKVDLAIIGKGRRILVSCKWSIRADREEQFLSDFEAYSRLESVGQDFEYALVTNEFDAARLKAACERRRENAPLFTSVVHINPTGVLAAYGTSGRGAANDISRHVASGRLQSFSQWFGKLLDGSVAIGLRGES